MIPVEPLGSCAWLVLMRMIFLRILLLLWIMRILIAARRQTKFGDTIVLLENDDERCSR